MRKQDIAVTTKMKSTIYAIGTSPETNDKVWNDPEAAFWGGDRNYTPGYVLEISDGGFVLVLWAGHYPGSRGAKHYEQASVLDALDYKLKDHEARQAVMAEYSHWPLSKEQSDAKKEALAKLKAVPKGWQVKLMRATYVRMLWAEYATKLEAKVTDRKDAAARKQREAEQATLRKKALVNAIVDLKIGLSEKEDDLSWVVRRNGDDELVLPIEVVRALVGGYKAPAKPDRNPAEVN